MLPYQFKEIYFKIIGEYENGICILFISDAERHMLVYEYGCFELVNKPAKANLDTYKRYLWNNTWFQTESHSIQQIFKNAGDSFEDVDNSSVYIKLDNAIIKIGMYFYTGDGQMVEDFSISNENHEPETYRKWLQDIAEAQPVEITDLRGTAI